MVYRWIDGFGRCLSSEERIDFFWKAELSSVATPTPEKEVANQWK